MWEYNTVQEHLTANGVAAKGRSMGAPGPTVAGGVPFVGTYFIGVWVVWRGMRCWRFQPNKFFGEQRAASRSNK